MHRLLAHIKELGKDSRRHIPVVRAGLHLLVATLHGISPSLGYVMKNTCVKELGISRPLTQREENPHALAMELGYGGLQQFALHNITKAGAIA